MSKDEDDVAPDETLVDDDAFRDAAIDAIMPSPERLRELVRRSPPPPEWFERDEPCPF